MIWSDLVPWAVSASLAGIFVYITGRDAKKREAEDGYTLTMYTFADMHFGKMMYDNVFTFDFSEMERRLIFEILKIDCPGSTPGCCRPLGEQQYPQR